MKTCPNCLGAIFEESDTVDIETNLRLCDCAKHIKPQCPIFQKPCLEGMCLAFQHREHRLIDLSGNEHFFHRIKHPHNWCDILNIELPVVKEEEKEEKNQCRHNVIFKSNIDGYFRCQHCGQRFSEHKKERVEIKPYPYDKDEDWQREGGGTPLL